MTYTRLKELKHSPQGKTYLASGPQGQVILKVFSLKASTQWKQLELFEREVQTLQSLEHPGIPRVLDYFKSETEDDLNLTLVTEYIDAPSLEDKLNQGWRCSSEELHTLAQQLFEILHYLHSLSPPVIHRDIKPSNMLWDGEQLYLIDFGGVQTRLYPDAQRGSTVIGTYGYMAPEQFGGKAIPQSDLYSVGATLLHLCSGVPPAEIEQEGLSLKFEPLVPEERTHWFARLLEPDPRLRYHNALEALEHMEARALTKRATQYPSQSLSCVGIELINDTPQYKVIKILPQEVKSALKKRFPLYAGSWAMSWVLVFLFAYGGPLATDGLWDLLALGIAMAGLVFPGFETFRRSDHLLVIEQRPEGLRLFSGQSNLSQGLDLPSLDLTQSDPFRQSLEQAPLSEKKRKVLRGLEKTHLTENVQLRLNQYFKADAVREGRLSLKYLPKTEPTFTSEIVLEKQPDGVVMRIHPEANSVQLWMLGAPLVMVLIPWLMAFLAWTSFVMTPFFWILGAWILWPSLLFVKKLKAQYTELVIELSPDSLRIHEVFRSQPKLVFEQALEGLHFSKVHTRSGKTRYQLKSPQKTYVFPESFTEGLFQQTLLETEGFRNKSLPGPT